MQQSAAKQTSQHRALGSLLAVALVLVVCWGQLLSATVCPLHAAAYAQTVGDTPDTGTGTADCELTSQLLNLDSYPLDIGLAASLALLWMLVWLTRRSGWATLFTEPITLKRRLHLYFCVFQE